MRIRSARAIAALLLIGALSAPTLAGRALAQIASEPGAPLSASDPLLDALAPTDSGPGALPSAGDPLLDAYQRLYGPGRMLTQQTSEAGRPEAPPVSDADETASMDHINKQLNNPVSSLWSLTFQNNFVISTGLPSDRERWAYNLNFQPVLPLHLTENWNLISRPVLPVLAGIDVPQVSGGQLQWTEKSGFGDMALVSLLSPNTSSGFIWGVGPTFIFPTASDRALGQGKWQIGPAAVGLYLGKEWIFGVLAQQWFSYAGDSSRPSVSQANFQYFIQHILPGHWQVGLAPNVTVNWKANGNNQLNFPIGLGVGKLVKFGKLPVKVTLELDYSVVKPDDFSQRWNVRLQVIPVLPALIKDPLSKW